MATRYIAFLRAVNVGGRTVRMADLRELLTDLGLTNVGTVIQTGNAYFDAGRASRPALVRRIETALEERFGFAVPTILRTCDEVQVMLDASALRYADGDPVVDKDRLVMFLDRHVDADVWPVTNPRGDVVITGVVASSTAGSDAFVELRRIDGRVPNSGAFVEKELGAVGTGRWLHTTAQILRTARDA